MSAFIDSLQLPVCYVRGCCTARTLSNVFGECYANWSTHASHQCSDHNVAWNFVFTCLGLQLARYIKLEDRLFHLNSLPNRITEKLALICSFFGKFKFNYLILLAVKTTKRMNGYRDSVLLILKRSLELNFEIFS